MRGSRRGKQPREARGLLRRAQGRLDEITGATTAQPAADGWHWEVQRLGRRVIRVMPER